MPGGSSVDWWAWWSESVSFRNGNAAGGYDQDSVRDDQDDGWRAASVFSETNAQRPKRLTLLPRGSVRNVVRLFRQRKR